MYLKTFCYTNSVKSVRKSNLLIFINLMRFSLLQGYIRQVCFYTSWKSHALNGRSVSTHQPYIRQENEILHCYFTIEKQLTHTSRQLCTLTSRSPLLYIYSWFIMLFFLFIFKFVNFSCSLAIFSPLCEHYNL